jgi:hypothetical protein
MILFVNGDSHSLGAMKPGSTGASFVDLVSQHLDCDVHNLSEAASSAQRILRTTKNYIATASADQLFVLIGWGTWEREEWEHEGKFYNVMPLWYKHLPDALQQRYHVWAAGLEPDHVDAKSRQIHEEIFDLHTWLQQQNIPHLFFNCMYNFFGIQPDQKKDWNNCYIGPYDNDASFYWYLTQKGYDSDKWYHFGPDGHRAWADCLISYIQEHKLL